MRGKTRPLRVVGGTISSGDPVIGIDLNGVLADANSRLIEHVKAKFGVDVSVADITKKDSLQVRLADITKDPRMVAAWLKRTVNDPEFILSLGPIPGVVQDWGALMALPLEPRIVTGHMATPETIAATSRWAQMYGFDVPIDFTRMKDGWCAQTRARYFIEDDTRRAFEIAETQTRIYVLARAYNEDAVHPSIIRVPSLLDVVTAIRHDLSYDGR